MASDNSGDFGQHRQTYDGFMVMVKWGTVAVAIIAAAVVAIIAS